MLYPEHSERGPIQSSFRRCCDRRGVCALCDIITGWFNVHTPPKTWREQIKRQTFLTWLLENTSKMVKQEQKSVGSRHFHLVKEKRRVFSRASGPGVWRRRPAATLWSETYFWPHPGSSWSIDPSAVTMKITQTRLLPSHQLWAPTLKV